MDTIRLSRYTWMWPVVGVMCWLVGRTIRAPCSRRSTSTEGPLIRWAFLGDRMVSLAGLLGLVVGVAVVVAPAPAALDLLRWQLRDERERHLDAPARFLDQGLDVPPAEHREHRPLSRPRAGRGA